MPAPNWHLDALGQAVSQARKTQGISRSRLAQTAGLDDYLVDAVERGEHDPPYDVLLALADALDETPSALFSRADALGRPNSSF